MGSGTMDPSDGLDPHGGITVVLYIFCILSMLPPYALRFIRNKLNYLTNVVLFFVDESSDESADESSNDGNDLLIDNSDSSQQ